MSGLRLPDAKNISVHEDGEDLGLSVAHEVADAAARAIAAKGVFRIALAGGETPRRCYESLRQMPLDWGRIEVYFGDERCLPEGDLQRNDSMAQDTLLGHVGIPSENVHPIPAHLGAVRAAEVYAGEIGGAGTLDLVLLGMGEDGHTASLFPGDPALENKALVVPVFDAPKPPPERVSLGLTALNAAGRRIFLISGAGKKGALNRILQGEKLPAAMIRDAEWHLDRAASPD